MSEGGIEDLDVVGFGPRRGLARPQLGDQRFAGAGDLTTAALVLERGRAVLLSESLQLNRAELDALAALGDGSRAVG